jgi:hypothetical protein
MDDDRRNNDDNNIGRDKVQQETHEVFEDVNLLGAVLFLFLLQLMQQIMNRGMCTC